MSTFSLHQIIALLISLIATLFAVYLFFKTPPEEREAIFSKQPERKPGIEYAPLHTIKERIIYIIKNLLWAIPTFLLLEFWFLPGLKIFSMNANCHSYGPINGVHLLFYGIFVIFPLLLAIVMFIFEGPNAIKSFKIAQYPPPNKKVFRLTPYKYGRAARLYVVLNFIPLVFLVGLSIWGSFLAYDLTREIKPCTNATSPI